jgi:hypothetical protein
VAYPPHRRVLLELLTKGPVAARTVPAEAREADVAWRIVERAKRILQSRSNGSASPAVVVAAPGPDSSRLAAC